ncbi:cob(I)yrinic acid a,c-diamide adenosyltransferase [Photobacterium swingsii]|uniref:cob(I)yrinic acid a,c-diamide adenosyltransferase n=1 Tax=Photobacterium swingsii TaxID=680026 RepID=UPI00406881ED
MLTVKEKNQLAQQTTRHKAMKAKVHEKSDLANDDKRRVLVLTGNGKGKTSSGFGIVFRAFGHGQGCAVVQYLKGDAESGERNVLQQLGVPVVTMNTGCSFKAGYCAERERIRAREVWQQTLIFLQDPSVDVLLLDEVTYMVARKHLDVNEMIAAFEARPINQSVIITGRAAHRKLREYADTVSRVDCVKHGLQIGLRARKGIEF